MLARFPVIFNPSARSQRGRRTMRFLMAHAQSFTLYASRSAEDAMELAADLAERGEPVVVAAGGCLLYTSPSPRDQRGSRMPSSA